VDYVRQRNERDPAYRYHPNELYDYLVRRLFRDRLHQDDEYDILFAKRGKSDRTAALLKALRAARRRFAQRWGILSEAPIHVIPATPAQCPSLQATDYFLWALQRLYERHDQAKGRGHTRAQAATGFREERPGMPIRPPGTRIGPSVAHSTGHMIAIV
jgi:hypothetical protein